MKLLFGISILFLFGACGYSSKQETTRKGKQLCLVDESFKPLIETAGYTFMGVYPDAELVFNYSAETKAINEFAAGKVRTIFVSRDFTPVEKKKLMTTNIEMRSTLVARDAVVFIVNSQNNDTLLTQEELKNVLSGNLKKWKTSQQPIEVVFDRVQSANFNYLLNWMNTKQFGNQVHAAKSTQEMMDYVKKYPNAIGVLGYNWISDLDDPVVKKRLKEFKTVGISDGNGNFWRANKATIVENKYPFIRQIWGITTSSANRISSGFIQFLDSQQGQLLMEKCELGPGRGTSREILLKEE